MLIIGIGGGTGCGKTTVVNTILKELPEGEVGVISQDSYYKATHDLAFEERNILNFPHFNFLIKKSKSRISKLFFLLYF